MVRCLDFATGDLLVLNVRQHEMGRGVMSTTDAHYYTEYASTSPSCRAKGYDCGMLLEAD
jgi:hypothetical protein